MGTKTMTLYQALSEKKILEKRVAKIQSLRLVCVKKKSGDTDPSGIALSEILEKSIKPGYASTIALNKNYIALKAAINDANARTMIHINGQDMSIANAISLSRDCDGMIRLYQRMLDNYASVENDVRNSNQNKLSDDAIAAYIDKVLGDNTKRDTNMVKTLRENYINDNAVEVYDPLDSKHEAEEALAWWEGFKRDLHFKMNQVNCNTEIEVEWFDA